MLEQFQVCHFVQPFPVRFAVEVFIRGGHRTKYTGMRHELAERDKSIRFRLRPRYESTSFNRQENS
jgi:hypothetical protein